jgi:hypothetical protein
MPIDKIEKEADLCALFIQEFNQMPGWTCYPEAAGFDVLVVHEDGRQIGVEAKMQLNAKVADQILPNLGEDYYGHPGPDHRLVIVSKITDASAGIAKMLVRLGVKVAMPRRGSGFNGDSFTFDRFYNIAEAAGRTSIFSEQWLYDWNPPERCQVPVLVTNLPAGVPSPVRLTPWKESALKVLAQLRRQGFITAKQIAGHGIGVTAWTQAPGSKPAWLAKGTVRGTWIETEHMPAFDKQHPDVYALAVETLAATAPAELELTP